jgi:hypothetical protein
MPKEKLKLKGQEAIDLWLQGHDVWDKWVDENPAVDVDFSSMDFSQYRECDFSIFKFPNGDVSFNEATFGEGMSTLVMPSVQPTFTL